VSKAEAPPPRGEPVTSQYERSDVCLITGASGFIGGRLAKRMVAEGHTVRCLVRASSVTSQLEQLGVELALGDLIEAGSLARAVEGCSYVFHCGALVSDWATTAEIARVNVDGTRSLLDASVAAGVKRLIHVSTTDVYGYPEGVAIDETHVATRFANWYAQTKRQAEAEIRRASASGALEAVILRPATVYGPGSKEVVGEIARAIQGRHMLLIGHGRANAGLCYVENLLDAALLALERDAASGEAFNVSDGLDVSWRRFTDDLAAGLGCPPVRWSVPYPLAYALGFSLEHGYRLLRRSTGLTLAPLLSRQAVQVLGKNQDFSNRKLCALLGWEPRVDYTSGIERTLDWLRSDHLSARD
jgi:nucleoside-diphosphate-sugar epimerase